MTSLCQRLSRLLNSQAASLWSELLYREMGVQETDPPAYVSSINFSCEAKRRFFDWRMKFKEFSNEEIKFVVTWWQRMENWLGQHAPSVLNSLHPPANSDEFHLFASRIKYPLPRLLRLFYSFHNGQASYPQDRRRNPHCLFGGYDVYNESVYHQFLSVQDMMAITLNIGAEQHIQRCYVVDIHSSYTKDKQRKPVGNLAIFVASLASPKFICCNDENIFTHLDRFDIFVPCVQTNSANSRLPPLFQWLQEYLTRLELGVFRYEPIDLTNPIAVEDSDLRRISLFAYSNNSALSHGIEVSPSPLFIPSLSSSTGELFFAYNIRMSAIPDRMQSKSLQLARRHWRIYSGGQEEVVDGEGVIGLFPLFERQRVVAHPFAYQSCTRITPPGAMAGTFDFIIGSLNDPQGEVQVKVPQFELSVPSFIF